MANTHPPEVRRRAEELYICSGLDYTSVARRLRSEFGIKITAKVLIAWGLEGEPSVQWDRRREKYQAGQQLLPERAQAHAQRIYDRAVQLDAEAQTNEERNEAGRMFGRATYALSQAAEIDLKYQRLRTGHVVEDQIEWLKLVLTYLQAQNPGLATGFAKELPKLGVFLQQGGEV